MPETLALVGLVMATVLYALLVRRRTVGRMGALSLSRALAASNEIALGRLRASSRPRKEAAQASAEAAVEPVFVERRAGDDRRHLNERRRGRGRRTGGDRRRGGASST
jgi:hypothetical protein